MAKEIAAPDHERGFTLKQLLLFFVGILVVVLLTGNFLLGSQRFQTYLEQQMTVHAQDAATALGLSLSSAVDASDRAAAGSMIDAIYDSGFYLYVRYVDLEGRVIVARESDGVIDGVPPWFRRLVKLPAPEGRAEVVKGWSRMGEVQVTVHPGQAYRDFWRYVEFQFGWFVVIGILAVLLMRGVLSVILKPLRQMEQQAHAFERRDFDYRAPMPRARELRRVVRALNDMAGVLGNVFRRQVALIEEMRREAHDDAVTGLLNRAEFDSRLRAELESKEDTAFGALILLQLSHFSEFNREHGREAGDRLLRDVAKALRVIDAEVAGALMARRTGSEFSLFLPGVLNQPLDELCQRLLALVEERVGAAQSADQGLVHVGAASGGATTPVASLLSQADTALRQAQSGGVSGYRRYHGDDTESRGAEEWRRVLEQAISEHRLRLYYQPVYRADRRTIDHYQVLSRLLLDSELVAASVFIPMAERFALMAELDREVIEQTIDALSSRWSFRLRLCVNIAVSSIADPTFRQWLEATLRQHPLAAKCLIFETSEYVTRYHLDALKALVVMGQRLGFGVSMDRFGASGVAFSYLRDLALVGLKLDRSYVREIDQLADKRFFVQSILPIAHGRGIQVFAVGVETEAEWQALAALEVDGAMGYLLGRPQEMPTQ